MSSTVAHGIDDRSSPSEPSSPTWRRIAAVLGDIKFAHTIFALPFALLSAHLAFLSIEGYRLNILLAILVCMVTARTAAMSFNRYLDRDMDSSNPRTQGRSLPSGKVKPSDTLTVVITGCVIFIATCWYLGMWPLILSVPTLAFLLLYSASKRFTVLTHLWLGTALAIAPMGAWIAVTGGWSWTIAILCVAVACWVAGFDVIYALQDVEFDKKNRVFSIPARIGSSGALLVARAFHLVSVISLVIFGLQAVLTWPYWVALALVVILIIIEHYLVKPDDLTKVGVAFFTVNGVISIVLYLSVIASTLVGASGVSGGVVQ